MAMRSLVVAVTLVVFLAGTAEAQTTVNPVDRREVAKNTTGTFLSYSSYVRNPTYGTEFRLFFEFDLSGYSSAATAVFKFSAYALAGASGTIYLRPMTSGEDGSVTTGDFSLLASPYWSTVITSSSQSFSVPLTGAWNARVGGGGFAGFALTAAPGVLGVVSTAQGSGVGEYTPVPEPGTFALFGLGLGSLFVAHRVRRRRKQRTTA